MPSTVNKPRIEIDGADFESLDDVFKQIEVALHSICPIRNYDDAIWNYPWDVLQWQLNEAASATEAGFTLVWKNHKLSEQQFGVDFSIKRFERELASTTDYRDIAQIQGCIDLLKKEGRGTTFQQLVKVIQMYGPDGDRSEHDIDLKLK